MSSSQCRDELKWVLDAGRNWLEETDLERIDPVNLRLGSFPARLSGPPQAAREVKCDLTGETFHVPGEGTFPVLFYDLAETCVVGSNTEHLAISPKLALAGADAIQAALGSAIEKKIADLHELVREVIVLQGLSHKPIAAAWPK